MVEFFRNIGTWLVEHKDGIVVFFTSSNFIAFISTIVLIVKQIAATKASITEVSTANQTLTKTNVLAENVFPWFEKISDCNTLIRFLNSTETGKSFHGMTRELPRLEVKPFMELQRQWLNNGLDR